MVSYGHGRSSLSLQKIVQSAVTVQYFGIGIVIVIVIAIVVAVVVCVR
jgi:hypothetical protein